MQSIVAEWCQRILAVEAATPLRLRGGGSKDFYGQDLRGDILDTRAYTGIVAYEPTELVITARCGTPLAEIEAVLAEQGQMLAFEPPHFGTATIGGAVASGLSGPRRASAGAVRDFVLGATVIDGEGRVLKFGGQVMKNVAGYDVSRLLAGSLGTLSLILDVSLKVLPKPVAEQTRRLQMSAHQALQCMNTWSGQPLPISATCWHDGLLDIRLSGASAAVTAAQAIVGGDELEDGNSLWSELRDQRHRFFGDQMGNGEPLWRLSLPSVAPPLVVPGETLIEWGGSQRWLRGSYDANLLRQMVAGMGGHATLFRGGDKSCGVFQSLPAPMMALQQRLKQSFDRRGVFSPGRLYANL